eukprot:CAMPEP_0170611172 /NCGR_PEP_ID=MMETSP0224-20130122/23049_1 /TAXON_ID=285029 /ORGANISM="Togula jolla, Strain CCCM 725" /LENGTH=415 /DNA_ID=CAMNT_0010936593 /DNA_START=20 /DNA_END=1267 /DNA_ORIENTATION=+
MALALPRAPGAAAPPACGQRGHAVVERSRWPSSVVAARGSTAASAASSAAAASAVAAAAVIGRARRSRREMTRRRGVPEKAADRVASGAAPAAAEGRLVRYLSGDGTVSVRALVATDVVRQVCEQHDCSAAVSVALGRALMGTALLASGRDTGETMQMRIEGTGPVGTIITEANASLECRGFAGNPQADAPTIPELIGLGEDATLRLSRTHPYWKSPYTGTSLLKTGEIAEDIVQYLAMSEQTPASMGLNVQWDSEANRIGHAEGWLVTLLPGWDKSSVGVVEANIASILRMEDGKDPRPEAICKHLMSELLGTFQAEETVRCRCNCSTSRLLTAVMMLGKMEVLRILRDKEDVDARCDWCGRRLSLTLDEIREHMNSDKGKVEVELKVASPRQLKLKSDEELMEAPEPGSLDWH